MKKIHLKTNFANHAYFIYDCTSSQFFQFLRKKYSTLSFGRDDDFNATIEAIIYNDQPYYYIWTNTQKINKWPLILSICHEVNHLVYKISYHLGITLSNSSEEFFTYLHEDLCNQIFKAISPNKRR